MRQADGHPALDLLVERPFGLVVGLLGVLDGNARRGDRDDLLARALLSFLDGQVLGVPLGKPHEGVDAGFQEHLNDVGDLLGRLHLLNLGILGRRRVRPAQEPVGPNDHS